MIQFFPICTLLPTKLLGITTEPSPINAVSLMAFNEGIKGA